MSLRPGIELVSCTPDAEALIERSGRESYGSPLSDTVEGRERWITARVRGWELDVLEHASATFLITCSRVCSHQIVRHRIAAYTQQSQRFRSPQAQDMTLIPAFVKPEDEAEWLADYAQAYAVFQKWRGRGYHRQAARYHLPEGSMTSLVCTWNFREIRHICQMRATPKADPEFQGIARSLLALCLERWPAVFRDLSGLEAQP